MSRIGKKEIVLPDGVEVTVSIPDENPDETTVVVKGRNGTLKRVIPSKVQILQVDNRLVVKPYGSSREARAMHGLYRTLIANMVLGVHDNFTIDLNLVGVGYRSQLSKEKISLSLGFSHEIDLLIPEGISVNVNNNTEISISGMEKEGVGLFASKIRAIRPPEPYNGKGVFYKGEVITRKAGKVGK